MPPRACRLPGDPHGCPLTQCTTAAPTVPNPNPDTCAWPGLGTPHACIPGPKSACLDSECHSSAHMRLSSKAEDHRTKTTQRAEVPSDCMDAPVHSRPLGGRGARRDPAKHASIVFSVEDLVTGAMFRAGVRGLAVCIRGGAKRLSRLRHWFCAAARSRHPTHPRPPLRVQPALPASPRCPHSHGAERREATPCAAPWGRLCPKTRTHATRTTRQGGPAGGLMDARGEKARRRVTSDPGSERGTLRVHVNNPATSTQPGFDCPLAVSRMPRAQAKGSETLPNPLVVLACRCLCASGATTNANPTPGPAPCGV